VPTSAGFMRLPWLKTTAGPFPGVLEVHGLSPSDLRATHGGGW
jgi:hypothetical protein